MRSNYFFMFQLLSESLYKKVLIPLTVHVCGSCIKISNLFIWTNFFKMSNLHGYYPLGKAMSSLQFLLSISKRLIFAFECDYDIDLVKFSPFPNGWYSLCRCYWGPTAMSWPGTLLSASTGFCKQSCFCWNIIYSKTNILT